MTMPGMKRLIASALWTYSTWVMVEAIAAVLGLPLLAPIGYAAGLAVGAFVWTDPRGLFWPRKQVVEEPKAVQTFREDRLAA
jgi:hypothetical protein